MSPALYGTLKMFTCPTGHINNYTPVKTRNTSVMKNLQECQKPYTCHIIMPIKEQVEVLLAWVQQTYRQTQLFYFPQFSL